jgi:hypothetical protein
VNGRAWRWASWILVFTLALTGIASTQANQPAPFRRVNAPYFRSPDYVHYERSAVFWLGQVNSTDNYADVRLGYDDTELYIDVAIFDRWLWYNPNPASSSLTDWDAVSLYLDMDGNTGNAPGASGFRLDAQLTWWENPRAAWQAVYRGTGSGWTSATIPFTTTAGWQGNVPNNNSLDDRGWVLSYDIPFASLGLSGPPPEGTLWGLGVVVHDRDNAAGSPPVANKTWPENMDPDQPLTWGQLRFGLPVYIPPPAVSHGTTTIRQGLNGAVVPDAAVGGTIGNLCPGDSTYIWNQWANFKDSHGMQFNVQNQSDISDWPCFAKYFVTFPLEAVPAGKVIISATLTLHQFGNAGEGWNPPPEPSYLQVLTIGQDWSEDTLTWNTAPLARENIGGAWVDPLPGYGGDPGVARLWDISRAVAEAYLAGEPLRLAVYSADGAYHSGRYFWSSDHDDWRPEARPTVTVVWGEPLAVVQQAAWPLTVKAQRAITYTLSMLGSGRALTLTDDLPGEVSAPLTIQVQGSGAVSFDQMHHRLTWYGAPVIGQPVTITFPVTVLTFSPTAIKNRAVLSDALPFMSWASTIVLANPQQMWLPQLRK